MPMVKCTSCPRILEFERDDVRERQFASLRFDIECPGCRATNKIPQEILESMFPTDPEAPKEKVLAEVPAAPEHKPFQGDTAEEKAAKGLRALKAMEECGNNVREAAKKLDVSPATVRNWLEHLPSDLTEAK
jgi:DNA-binding NtrC family response regulator